MNTDQVNYLNIGLMILSCVIAFILPFELFLFSYAILGPLHYLTEISWLHKRQYFSPGKKDFMVLGLITVMISIPVVFNHFYRMLGPKDIDGATIISDETLTFLQNSAVGIPVLFFISFATAALFLIVKERGKRIIGLILLVLIGYAIRSQHFISVIFAIFIPTLVHVFIFTGAFILLGALRSKSFSGILSLIVFVGCAISFFFLFPNAATGPAPYTLKRYDTVFYEFNQMVFDVFLHKANATKDMIYNSSIGIMITRFISYAYTYHYLNWFSKTSVIKWHKVPRKSLITVIAIWIVSIALYLWDYKSGLMALYFLSILHVIFEFPLNFRSFHDIGLEIKKRLTPAKA